MSATSYFRVPSSATSRALILLAFIGAASLIARLIVAGRLQHPGQADPAFYYGVGLNIARGQGFYVDYVWHYLGGLAGIPSVSTDYWMPLTSLIVAGPLALAGDSHFAALLRAILCAYALAALAYMVARQWDDEFAAYTAPSSSSRRRSPGSRSRQIRRSTMPSSHLSASGA